MVTPGVSAQTLALFCREMSAMLRAGVTLDMALDQAGLAGPYHFRSALGHIASNVRAGYTLGESMACYRALFNPALLAAVSAAERSGTLDMIFGTLAGFYEEEAALVRDLRGAMVYPSCVVVVAIAAVFLLAYINMMPNTWGVRLLWGAGGVAALWLAMRFRWVQRAARYVAMLLPFFGGVIHELAVARFCRTFGTLVQAGVPYLEGLEATTPAVQHPMVEQAARNVYFGVRNGNSVEQSIRAQPAFPAIVRNLVGAGETAGSLDQALLKAAEYLHNDAQYKIRNSARLAGPVMIIILGVIVALILVAFWSSYIKMVLSVGEE
jgi:type II secretory pathway component PulF